MRRMACFMCAKVQLYVETTKIFFEFLRFCIGSAKEIPGSLKEVDWKELYRIAQKQALLGERYGRIYME